MRMSNIMLPFWSSVRNLSKLKFRYSCALVKWWYFWLFWVWVSANARSRFLSFWVALWRVWKSQWMSLDKMLLLRSVTMRYRRCSLWLICKDILYLSYTVDGRWANMEA